MTRYVMTADLNRCVGCQTCTAACKHTNATPPEIQWRKVLDVEMGEFPNVERIFKPVGCQHCEDPPCMHVCPSTATAQRDDGIVTIDYDEDEDDIPPKPIQSLPLSVVPCSQPIKVPIIIAIKKPNIKYNA